MNKVKVFIIIAVVYVLGTLVLFVFLQNKDKKSLVIEIQNASAELYQRETTEDKLVKNNISKNDTLRLKKGDYLIKYTGDKGFTSDVITFSLDAEKTITINPDPSKEKLEELLVKEIPLLQEAIKSSFLGLDSYTVSPGRLLGDGSWYGTTFSYKGTDVYNADSLRAILKKENNTWKVVAGPMITISKAEHKNIPGNIIDITNNELYVELDRRFLGEAEKQEDSLIPYDD